MSVRCEGGLLGVERDRRALDGNDDVFQRVDPAVVDQTDKTDRLACLAGLQLLVEWECPVGEGKARRKAFRQTSPWW